MIGHLIVCFLVALLLLSTPAYAVCPIFETVRGSGGVDTLSGTRKKATLFYGKGSRDTFRVEEPQLFSYTGCTSKDYWDEIRDYQNREIIDIPGTVKRYRVSGCLVMWQNTTQTHSGWYFVLLNRCGLEKSDVVVR